MLKLSFSRFRKMPAEEKRWTIPTMITLMRIALVPFIVMNMLWQQWGTACMLIVIASLTDIVDGYLARLWKQQTFLGACLDPIADKLLVLSCYLTLAFVQSPLFAIPLWFVCLVLCKELLLIGGATIVYIRNGELRVQPTILGKMTMFVQVAFIVWLFACYFCKWLPVKTYYTMLGLVCVLVLASLWQYARIGLGQLINSIMRVSVCVLLGIGLTGLAAPIGEPQLGNLSAKQKNNFTVPKSKKNNTTKALSSGRLKERIIRESDALLREELAFERVLLDLREQLHDSIVDGIEGVNFFSRASRAELQSCLDEIVAIRAIIEKNRVLFLRKCDILKKDFFGAYTVKAAIVKTETTKI